MWIPFSSSVMVSRDEDITFNGPTVFAGNFVIGSFARRADSVICAGSLSTKMGCPG